MQRYYCFSMSESEIHHSKKEELQLLAQEAEEHVRQRNIFYRTTLEKLIDLEDKIDQIALETGLEIEQIISDVGIKSPLTILNDAIQHWEYKLQRGNLGSEKELIDNLSKDFQINVRRTMKSIVPLNEQEEKDESDEESHPVPDDYNRVTLALHTLLKLKIHDEEIQLDDIEVVVGVPPQKSWRERPYWIVDLQKYKIAIFLNNQSRNRTFVVNYETKKELDEMMEWTKNKFKEEKAEGKPIQHFAFHDEAQFVEDLQTAIQGIVEKNIPIPMNEKYFVDPENIKSDLQGFFDEYNKNRKNPKKIEDIEFENIRLIPYKCKNGEEIAGGTYINRAGVAFKMAKNRRAAFAKHDEILDKLLQIAQITKTEKVKPMDEEYYKDPENIRKDLNAFLVEVKKQKRRKNPQKIEDLSVDAMCKVKDLVACSNNEKVNGFTYILRAGKPLGMSSGTKESGKKMKAIFDELKKRVGIEAKNYPEMNVEYFEKLENIKKDLQAFADESKVTIENLMTNHLDGTSVECSNQETIEGKTYLSRAAKALDSKIKSTPEAGKIMGDTLKTLKRKIGIEIKEFSEMDEKYFSNPQNIRQDLENLRAKIVASERKKNRIPQKIADLSTYDFKKIDFVCTNGETVSGLAYLGRAAKGLNLMKEPTDKQKRKTFEPATVLAKLIEKCVATIEQAALKEEQSIAISEKTS